MPRLTAVRGARGDHRSPTPAAAPPPQITPELVSKLTGTPTPRLDSDTAGGGTAQAVREPDQAERDASAMVRRSELLQRALERSRRVGDALLVREDEEMEKIESLAEELIAREYAAPVRERPCQAEAANCLQCYRANAADPVACSDAVAAYSACAREATAAVLRASEA